MCRAENKILVFYASPNFATEPTARIIELRSDAAAHPLTTRAVVRMTDLIERSERFQNGARPQAEDVE